MPNLPLLVERQPFLIGRKGEELMVHVDLDSPRVSQTEGEPVFLPHGGASDYLDRINSSLLTIHQGLEAAGPFVAAAEGMRSAGILRAGHDADDGSQGRLAGFYAINEDRLAALEPEALGRLHRAGYLQAIYMVVASLSNFRSLIERKNRVQAAAR
jgi:hypothetical protein